MTIVRHIKRKQPIGFLVADGIDYEGERIGSHWELEGEECRECAWCLEYASWGVKDGVQFVRVSEFLKLPMRTERLSHWANWLEICPDLMICLYETTVIVGNEVKADRRSTRVQPVKAEIPEARVRG